MDIHVYLKKIKRSIEDIKVIRGSERMKAVENNGDALQYVKDQTESICMKAVENNGYALQYVDISVFKSEKIEMTIKSIEEKLGYEVKIVK